MFIFQAFFLYGSGNTHRKEKSDYPKEVTKKIRSKI